MQLKTVQLNTIQLKTLEDTAKLATLLCEKLLEPKLQAKLSQAALLILSGELGAGKTTLTQAIAQELGSDAQVSSPTYTLIHEYPTPEGLLVHIDAYRLDSADGLLSLGLEDYLDRARLVVVEWGEDLLELFPEAWLLKLSLHLEQEQDQQEKNESSSFYREAILYKGQLDKS